MDTDLSLFFFCIFFYYSFRSFFFSFVVVICLVIQARSVLFCYFPSPTRGVKDLFGSLFDRFSIHFLKI